MRVQAFDTFSLPVFFIRMVTFAIVLLENGYFKTKRGHLFTPTPTITRPILHGLISTATCTWHVDNYNKMCDVRDFV